MKNRTIFFTKIAIVALLLSSCSTEEVDNLVQETTDENNTAIAISEGDISARPDKELNYPCWRAVMEIGTVVGGDCYNSNVITLEASSDTGCACLIVNAATQAQLEGYCWNTLELCHPASTVNPPISCLNNNGY